MIVTLKPGERVPEGTPSRFVSSAGYIRLRWKVGRRLYLEALEHRVVDGYVTTAEHVHHINRQRDDNRPENLEFLSSQEHSARHRSDSAKRCVALYQQGFGTTTIGRLVGLNSSYVWRLLESAGVLERGRSWVDYATPMPSDAQIRAWHSAGVRVSRMMALAGVSRKRIEDRLAELGLPRFRPGAPGGEFRTLTNEQEKAA